MKVAIISFILYVIYDTYMRNREKNKYVTREELEKFKQDNDIALKDFTSAYYRLNNLEQSPYQ